MSQNKKLLYLLASLALVSVALSSVGGHYQTARHRALTLQLEDALGSGKEARAIELLKLGAEANANGQDGTPLVFDALRFETASVLKAFIAAGVDVNGIYSPVVGKRVTLLTNLGHWGESLYPYQIDMMKCLLTARADPNLGTESVLAISAGGCGEACWCNPRKISLLLSHGAKTRKGDANAILQAALDGDDMQEENGPRLLRLWASLVINPQERPQLLKDAIKRFSGYRSFVVDEDERDRIKTLTFLRHELRKMADGHQLTESR